jgi:hypothetical protein
MTPYLFSNLNDSSNSYLFETDLEIIYQIKFKPTPYLFGDHIIDVSEYIFEFIIDVVNNPNSKLPPNDKKVGATVVAIFIDFYAKIGNAVSIYICESSDGKEFIRKRKFDQWFAQFNDNTFVKIDEMIVDSNKKLFPISLIISKLNPKRAMIIDAFIEIATINSK